MGLVSSEMRIVTSKKEAVQSVGFDQNFTGHPLSFGLKIVDEPVNALSNLAMYQPVATCPVDVCSNGFGKSPKLTDRVGPSIPGECLFKLTMPICDGHSEPIFLRVTHTVMNDSTVGIPVKPNAQSEGKPNGIPG